VARIVRSKGVFAVDIVHSVAIVIPFLIDCTLCDLRSFDLTLEMYVKPSILDRLIAISVRHAVASVCQCYIPTPLLLSKFTIASPWNPIHSSVFPTALPSTLDSSNLLSKNSSVSLNSVDRSIV